MLPAAAQTTFHHKPAQNNGPPSVPCSGELARSWQKKRRKPPESTPAEVTAKPAPLPIDDDDMELPPLDLNNNDFIPIEDLPSEKFEIPSELLGKFEATKMEVPVMPAKEPKTEKSAASGSSE